MFPWSKDAEEKNRKNVILLAKHLKTLKGKRRSSTRSSRSSSSTRSSSKSSKSRSSSRSSSKSRRSSKRSKKRTRKLEARLDEQAKLLAQLPRNSAVKRMIQDELKVKTQAEGEMLAKMTAMADSLKAQKDATELQIATLKAEIKMKKEQGEDTAKETKELQQVMVEQVKTDATIARIEKYGGVLANGLNASGTMLANVGTAVKGATYGLGDLTKSLGTNALGAAYGVGNITKSLGANALGAAYGLGNAASSGVYGLGNMARDVHKNKEVAGYFGDKVKLAAKIGALGAPAFVVGHAMDFNQTTAAVNTALNTDIAKTLQKMAVKAPSLKQEQAVVEEIIHTQRDQAAIAKKVPATKQAAVQIKVAAVEMKDQLKVDKAVADKPSTAPIDDKAYLKLLADFKMTDPIAKYVELWAGKKLRSEAIQEKIVAVGSKYMKHLKEEILQYQRIIRDAPVHETREDEFESVAADYVKPFKSTRDLKGMKLLFGHYVTLAKFAENLPYFATPSAQAAQVRDVNERAVSAEKAGDAALEAIARQSPPRVLNQAAADAAQAAVAAVEAGPEAVGAALQGMEAAMQATAFAEQQAAAFAERQGFV